MTSTPSTARTHHDTPGNEPPPVQTPSGGYGNQQQHVQSRTTPRRRHQQPLANGPLAQQMHPHSSRAKKKLQQQQAANITWLILAALTRLRRRLHLFKHRPISLGRRPFASSSRASTGLQSATPNQHTARRRRDTHQVAPPRSAASMRHRSRLPP